MAHRYYTVGLLVLALVDRTCRASSLSQGIIPVGPQRPGNSEGILRLSAIKKGLGGVTTNAGPPLSNMDACGGMDERAHWIGHMTGTSSRMHYESNAFVGR